MERNYFRIGSFCKEFGISSEFLKFYDRQGLLSPVWRDDASYRYYAGYQSVFLAEYYRLSRLGFSLSDSKTLMQEASLAQYVQEFEKRRDALTEELQQQQVALDYIDSFLIIAQLLERKESWYLEPIDSFCFCSSDKSKKGNPWWKRCAQLPEAWQRVRLGEKGARSLSGHPFDRTWGSVAAVSAAEELKDYFFCEKVEGGRCFLYYHSIPGERDEEGKLSDRVWDFSEPLRLMGRHALVPRGDLYQKRLCVTHEAEGEVVHVLTMIPLE